MILSCCSIVLSWIFKAILYTLGWNLIDLDVLARLTKNNRSVIVFSHTSYIDFYILLMYLLAYPIELVPVRMLVKPDPFFYMGWILRHFGAIPATRVEDKNGGAVVRIVEELKQSPACYFLISPKGTIVKREWRSGYYHIAQLLQAPLLVAGLDYEKKCVSVSTDISYDTCEDTIESFLKKQLESIVPLYPEDEVVSIRKHNISKRTVVNWYTTIVVLVIVVSTIIIRM